MIRFPVLLQPVAESAFVAFVPDLPQLEPIKGRLDELVHYLVRREIDLHLEQMVKVGQPIPSPLSIDTHFFKGAEPTSLWTHVDIDPPTPDSMAREEVESLFERLTSIAHELPNWFAINREEVMERLIGAVLASYRALPSPDEIEGIDTGLDFIGLLMTEGGDHYLYAASMKRFEGDVYHEVNQLGESEQIVLLAPFCNDFYSLVERDVSEWAELLVRDCYDSWAKPLLRMILSRIEPKYRHEW